MFSTFLPNHETYVKTESGVSSWVNDGQKPLSFLSNSSFLSQKHSLKKNHPLCVVNGLFLGMTSWQMMET